MAHIRMSRAGRKYNIRSHMVFSEHDVHTVNSIAKICGMEPSSYLRQLLMELVREGHLEAYTYLYKDGFVKKRVYSVKGRLPSQSELFEIGECI